LSDVLLDFTSADAPSPIIRRYLSPRAQAYWQIHGLAGQALHGELFRIPSQGRKMMLGNDMATDEIIYELALKPFPTA